MKKQHAERPPKNEDCILYCSTYLNPIHKKYSSESHHTTPHVGTKTSVTLRHEPVIAPGVIGCKLSQRRLIYQKNKRPTQGNTITIVGGRKGKGGKEGSTQAARDAAERNIRINNIVKVNGSAPPVTKAFQDPL